VRSTEPNGFQRGAGHGRSVNASVDQTEKLRAPRSLVRSLVSSTPRPASQPRPVIYWHRALPPADAEPIGEHIVEATSARVFHALVHRDELWGRCYEELMARARDRLEQEITRLGGDCAHVLEEHVESRSDPVTSESWLQGRFRYVLYRAVVPNNRGVSPVAGQQAVG
jgi:hypothetical protein